MIVSRREEEVVSINTPAGNIVSLRIVRARNGAVSIECDLPPGHELLTGIYTDCDGRVRVKPAGCPSECCA